MGARRALALLLGALILVGPAAVPTAAAAADGTPVTIVLFHGDGCPHCAAELAFLAALVKEHPQVRVEAHEVWYDSAGQELMLQTAEDLSFDAVGVPITVIGDEYWIGFDESIAEQIEAAVDREPAPAQRDAAVLDLPIVGSVSVADTSLLAATLAIGFIDGINPCSLWVLSLLLAIVLSRGSRGRVMVVGAVFLAVTAAMYGVYLLGLYSAASYLGGMSWLRLVVVVVAGAFGLLQLKDGLGISGGPSLSISSQRRPALYARMRRVSSPEQSVAVLLAGTVVLAVAVSLLETPCTAGLPLLWTSMLAEQGVGAAQAVGLLIVYLMVFLADELLLFAAAVLTLRATRLQEHHGRALKLVAGSVLLALAGTMLVAPSVLTTLAGTVAVFAAALAAAGILVVVTARYGASSSSSSGRSLKTSRTTAKATDAE